MVVGDTCPGKPPMTPVVSAGGGGGEIPRTPPRHNPLLCNNNIRLMVGIFQSVGSHFCELFLIAYRHILINLMRQYGDKIYWEKHVQL